MHLERLVRASGEQEGADKARLHRARRTSGRLLPPQSWRH